MSKTVFLTLLISSQLFIWFLSMMFGFMAGSWFFSAGGELTLFIVLIQILLSAICSLGIFSILSPLAYIILRTADRMMTQ